MRSERAEVAQNHTLFSRSATSADEIKVSATPEPAPKLARQSVPQRHRTKNAQVVERPADVDIRSIDVPVLMHRERLLKARAPLRRLAVPLR